MKICFAGGFGHYTHAADTKENIVGVLVGENDTADYREFCKDKKQYTDYVTMLETEKPDAVVIDSIFNEHFPMALYALKHNIPSFCEKPVCLKLSELEILKNETKKNKTLLYGMFTTRFEAPFYTAKKLVEAGTIGDILLANGQKTYILGKREPFYYQPEKFGNTFSWIGIHSIEQVQWISGKKLTAHSYFHKKNNNAELDDRAVSACEFENMLATFTVDYLRPENSSSHGDDRLRLVGTKGIIEVIGGNVYLTADGKNNEKQPLSEAPMKIFDDFLASVKNEKKPVCSTEDTLSATQAVLEISNEVRC